MELSIKTGKHKSMRREDSEQAQGAHASCYKVRAPRTKIIKQPQGTLPYVCRRYSMALVSHQNLTISFKTNLCS